MLSMEDKQTIMNQNYKPWSEAGVLERDPTEPAGDGAVGRPYALPGRGCCGCELLTVVDPVPDLDDPPVSVFTSSELLLSCKHKVLMIWT